LVIGMVLCATLALAAAIQATTMRRDD